MSLLDRFLVAAGRAHAAISRRGESPVRARIVILALFSVSALAALVISLISIPSEKTFDDLRDRRYHAFEWIRLEGDLQDAGRQGQRYVFTLHDPADAANAVTVYAPGPLPTGLTEVTGQARTDALLPGTFDSFHADAVTEPARHDPWLLLATPALIALFLLLGGRVGYPVVRRQEASSAVRRDRRLQPGESVNARWSGRLEREERALDAPQACTVTVEEAEGAVRTLTVADEQGARAITTQRSSPKPVGRVCRVGGCTPHLEIHAPGGDVLLEFDAIADRDRVATALL